MFGLSWGQIIIIVLIGLFVLGPERIPVAVQWSMDGLKKLRNMAQGAQAQLQREIGPELEELRRQVADLQALREVQELRNLRDLNPRKMIGNAILGPENSGKGLTGFLGLDPTLLDAPGSDDIAAPDADGGVAAVPDPVADAVTTPAVAGRTEAPAVRADRPAQRSPSRLPPAAVINAGAVRAVASANGAPGNGAASNGSNGAASNGTVSLGKSAEAQRVPASSAPFDPDGT